MQVKDTLTKTAEFFKAKGIESARLDAELLLAEALGWERIQLYTRFDYPMTEAELAKAREMVRRRGQGEPIAYILQKKDFYKHSFFVGTGVLIPRPETEQIVELAVHHFREIQSKAPGQNTEQIRILDLGCGSGCLGLSILSELPQSTLVSIDASVAATEMTLRNARQLDLASRTTVLLGRVENMQEQFKQNMGEFDLIVANPPYIAENDSLVQKEVRQFEPHEALFADESGMGAIARWSEVASQLLKPGGRIYFEMGHDQGKTAEEVFRNQMANTLGQEKYQIVIHQDLAGLDRIVECKPA